MLRHYLSGMDANCLWVATFPALSAVRITLYGEGCWFPYSSYILELVLFEQNTGPMLLSLRANQTSASWIRCGFHLLWYQFCVHMSIKLKQHRLRKYQLGKKFPIMNWLVLVKKFLVVWLQRMHSCGFRTLSGPSVFLSQQGLDNANILVCLAQCWHVTLWNEYFVQ
jgi:hypothetical protein